MTLVSISLNLLFCTRWWRTEGLDFPFEQALEQLHCQVAFRQVTHLLEEVVVKDADVRLSRPGALKMSTTSFDTSAEPMICLTARSRFRGGLVFGLPEGPHSSA
jgi:hypothetical protein